MAIHPEIIKAIEAMDKVQPFTVDQIVRKLGEQTGEKFAGVFEIAGTEEIEAELKKEGIIKEFGTATLYIKA